MSLVLAGFQSPKAAKSIPPQFPEIIDYQGSATRINLNPFLWIRTVSIRKIINHSMRTVRISKKNRRIVRPRSQTLSHSAGRNRHNFASGKKCYQVDKVTRLPKNSSSTDLRIMHPDILGNVTGIEGCNNVQWRASFSQQLFHLLGMRRKTPIETNR